MRELKLKENLQHPFSKSISTVGPHATTPFVIYCWFGIHFASEYAVR
jgi:hypothetical protein